MKTNTKLLDLTNKFLQDFFDACEDKDDLFNFNFVLPEMIAQSNYPKYKEQTTILMGMASFDDSIAKEFFNNRIQGFVKSIEHRISHCENQEDYLVENINEVDLMVDDFDLEFFTTETGEHSFNTIPCKTEAKKITFNVRNTRSGFSGNVVINKKLDKEFINENEFIEKFIIQNIDFYSKNQRVMTIDYRYDYEKNSYCEEGRFEHYKYIADINSFFLILN